ncbi:MAG: cyclodeaminase/cyclohydrolase family protein [Streptosporangiales bacterium]|nr:cyclodeaminase/cyclohydrolase family protein [Streptosporangiales bacterium]MBO0890012.1 cyclodeaminase/cyclohydrolase family protein [Acidothermales bacterium]
MDGTVEGFLARMAERTPAPGGGGACAVGIAMGAALVAMAARYSTKQLPDADAMAAAADELRAEALPLVQADADAYGAFLEAMRDTSDERDQRIAVASQAACDVPLRMTELAVQVAMLAARVASDGNPRLVGDANTGALLCSAAARAAAHLVATNVKSSGLDPVLVERADDNAGRTARAARQIGGRE